MAPGRVAGLGGRDLALVSLVCLAWAGNFLTSKLALLEFPPLLFTALRLCLRRRRGLGAPRGSDRGP